MLMYQEHPDYAKNSQNQEFPQSKTSSSRREPELPKFLDQGAHNQALGEGDFYIEHGLKYRSRPELRIARAFDKANVLFLPNCRARLSNQAGQRVNREPDFLVLWKGKWGILEVDGEGYHPSSRTVNDHERDRLFKRYGVRTVEHFDAEHCFKRPDEVVEEFLHLL